MRHYGGTSSTVFNGNGKHPFWRDGCQESVCLDWNGMRESWNVVVVGKALLESCSFLQQSYCYIR
jgi:hypothetical protein